MLAAPADNLRGAFVDVLKAVTAFTLAHSLTLTLASLSLISLPSRLVESAIAASVILAALNNLYPLFAGGGWAAFGFGLIHGFGFASVLIDLGLPTGRAAGQPVRLQPRRGDRPAVHRRGVLPLAFLLRRTWFYHRLLTGGSP
jgi:hypothetical protein